MSPLVWDLAHIGNQEELWLLRDVGGREAMRPEIDDLYDAFEHSRAERPTLPLLPPAEARTYAAEVRDRVLDVLERAPFEGTGTRLTEAGFAFGMIAQHEQQHDETMLITHQLREGPAGARPRPTRRARARRSPVPAEVLVPGGPFTMGTSTEPWALDNERPAHRREVAAFCIDTTPVTNAAYQAFIADGGYERPALVDTGGLGARAPTLACTRRCSGSGTAGSGCARRFGVTELVPPDEPVRARVLVRGRRVRPLGRAPAAHRGGVGEGRPARPGDRPLAALPVGRRRPDPRARQPRPAASAAGARRQLPGGRVAARRTPVDR